MSQLDTPRAPVAEPASEAAVEAVTEVLSPEAFPTSFGAFNPVGHVMVGLPQGADFQGLTQALHAAAWPPESLLKFAPGDAVSELQLRLDQAGPLSGFGYEIVLLRRYLELAQQGCQWLLVKVADNDQAQQVADLARTHSARLVVHYRGLTVEELLWAEGGMPSPSAPGLQPPVA